MLPVSAGKARPEGERRRFASFFCEFFGLKGAVINSSWQSEVLELGRIDSLKADSGQSYLSITVLPAVSNGSSASEAFQKVLLASRKRTFSELNSPSRNIAK
jgi:hypothetical protein